MKESNGKTKETRGYAPINGLKRLFLLSLFQVTKCNTS
jgi:hypothetical protein